MKQRDSHGIFFDFEEAEFDWHEKEKIRSEINNVYHRKYKGERLGIHYSDGLDDEPYAYLFENHGFDDYNFFARFPRKE